MKKKLTNPKSLLLKNLLFLFFLSFTIMSYSANVCRITGYEFTDGTSSISIIDGETYNINDLPDSFYLELIASGDYKYARYIVENVDTGAIVGGVDGNSPYTFPPTIYSNPPEPWNLGVGTFRIYTRLTSYTGNIFGELCAENEVTFTIAADDNVCNSNAGTMSADTSSVTLVNGSATISATANGDANVPSGYSNIYVLTQGDELVILNAGPDPSFEVTEAGDYTIHSLVYDPNTLDLDIIEFGTTTGFDVNGLLIQGGGTICASLDVPGALIIVNDEEECLADAALLFSPSPINCLSGGTSVISAIPFQAALIPNGYQELFVLTEAFTLTILDVDSSPEFEVANSGFYRIHSLIYNPATLDLTAVVPGQTTGFDVLNLIENNNICASLDPQGALNLVIANNWFCNFYTNYYDRAVNNQNESLKTIIDSFDNYEAFKKSFINENSEIRLYPNPVVSEINVDVQLFDDENIKYTVTDTSGRQVMSGTLLNTRINANSLSNGMYLVKLESDYRVITKKIIVNK